MITLAGLAGLAEVAHAEPTAPPPPYAAPFQLRPTGAASVARADTAFAFYDDEMGGGTTIASTWLASYRVNPTLAPLARIAIHHDTPTATGISNGLLGVTWAPKLPDPFRIGILGAVTLPIGTGGGNAPNADRAAANRAAVFARSGMDNALFAVNDLTLIGGASVAYVDRGLTVQGEVTLFELVRVRGDEVQPDTTKTNMTSGLFAGYFVVPQLSVGGELRYQRWLAAPKAVEMDTTGKTRDTVTAAIGVRGHLELAGKQWLRPALSYARGLDDPMQDRSYQIVQLDIIYAY